MSNYYVKRLISVVLTIFLIATITFFLMRAIPGGPFTRERPVSPEILANLEAKYNLDDPIFIQYLDSFCRHIVLRLLSYLTLWWNSSDI